MNKLYRIKEIGLTAETHLSNHTVKSQIIYVIILVTVISLIVALPFVYIEIGIYANGFIRPVKEKTEIPSLVSGIVSSVYKKEGDYLNKGDALLVMVDKSIKSKIEFSTKQMALFKSYVDDIKSILCAQTSELNFQNPKYRQVWKNYKQKVNEIDNRYQKALKEMKRNSILFDRGVLSEKKFDDIEFELRKIEEEQKSFRETTISGWQDELANAQINYEQAHASLEQYKQEKEQFLIVSPVNGTLERFAGIFCGSNIKAGQVIAVISPDTELIAELLVSPKDIGYLSQNMKCRVQVDAFNYREWGMIDSRIKEISDDYINVGNSPCFRVRCHLGKNSLSLENGVKGELKKGMTVRSRFILTKRSIWQLLFDNVDDWLNPSLNNHKN